MDFKNQFTRIETDDSLMELTPHGSSDYPFHYYYENLALFDFNCVDWHWHSELEFVYIESGEVTLDIGEIKLTLSTGQGIMINSKILHRLQSETDAIIPNFLFMPSFIAPGESLIYEKYVSPIISSSLDYIVFKEDIPWQADALRIIKKIIDLQDIDCNQELSVSMYIQKLWIIIIDNITYEPSDHKSTIVSRTRLQLMMQFIHTHYSENISLDEIAGSACISKSTALHLFHDKLKMTPVNYLIYFRLKKAAMSLLNTEKKITIISSEAGFNNVDHFCRSFKKTYGMTPTDYRNQGSYN